MNRLAILASTVEALERHLEAAAPLEEGAFCLIRQGVGTTGIRFLATDVLLPPPGAWEAQGSDRLRPTAQWVSAAVSQAIQAGAGLLFVHSHPDPKFPTGLSWADEQAHAALAPVLGQLLDGPFGTAVVHPHGWTATMCRRGKNEVIEKIAAVGRTLRCLSPRPAVARSPLDARQRDALGTAHDELRRLSVAVVGCGGIGSPLAEQITRMGVGRILLVDNDYLDTPSNVRRVFGSRVEDLNRPEPRSKVDVVGGHLLNLGLNTQIDVCHGDVRIEPVFRRLLDVDVVLSCTDTHGSRAVLNDLASSYLLPVIDVGVRVGSRPGGSLCGLTSEIRVLTPMTPCLWCRGTISGDTIRVENLPKGERERLQRDGYVSTTFGQPAPSVVALTVLASGMSACALATLISAEGDVAPAGYLFDGFFGDAYETQPRVPLDGCRCRRSLGLGDTADPPFLKA